MSEGRIRFFYWKNKGGVRNPDVWITGKPEVIRSSLGLVRINDLVLIEFGRFNSGDVKGTIPISQGAISAKLCLPTPFDFNNLRFVAALSRQRPRVRVPSSPPFLSED